MPPDEDKKEEKTAEADKAEKITSANLKNGMRVILRYMASYKREIVTLSVLGIIAALADGIVPYVSGKFFDSLITPHMVHVLSIGMQLFTALLILWTIVQLVSYFLNWRISIMSELLSNAIWLDYLSKGFGYLLNLPISFHKREKIGEIIDKISNAANSLETITGRIVIDLAPQVLSIVIAVAVAFFMNWILALILIVGVLSYIVAMYVSVKPLAGYQKEYRTVLWTAWGNAQDAVNNTIAIKQATSETYEQDRIAKKMKSAVPLWMRLQKGWSNLTLYQQITILVTRTAILIISIFMIQKGTITIGDLLAFNAYAALMFAPFVTIGRNWQTIQTGIVNMEVTEDILSLPPEDYEPKGSERKPLLGSISLRNVSFQYEEGKSILENISLEVKAGEVVALVGESGVGKSTLIDLISGYHFPTQGEVLIDGVDIRTVNLRSLREQIGVVPQEVVLFDDTILMNIKYGNFHATDIQVRNAAVKAHALDFIEKFPKKWEQIVGERGIKLSVGQKQRVSIARAILRDPRILILDEPTSALDAGSEQIITRSLDELMKGRTTFIIAHRLSTVRKADKIFVFKDGRIIETGTHDELLKIKGGEYRRLYELQIGLHG